MKGGVGGLVVRCCRRRRCCARADLLALRSAADLPRREVGWLLYACWALQQVLSCLCLVCATMALTAGSGDPWFAPSRPIVGYTGELSIHDYAYSDALHEFEIKTKTLDRESRVEEFYSC